jgi:hypothetical protein
MSAVGEYESELDTDAIRSQLISHRNGCSVVRRRADRTSSYVGVGRLHDVLRSHAYVREVRTGTLSKEPLY